MHPDAPSAPTPASPLAGGEGPTTEPTVESLLLAGLREARQEAVGQDEPGQDGSDQAPPPPDDDEDEAGDAEPPEPQSQVHEPAPETAAGQGEAADPNVNQWAEWLAAKGLQRVSEVPPAVRTKALKLASTVIERETAEKLRPHVNAALTETRTRSYREGYEAGVQATQTNQEFERLARLESEDPLQFAQEAKQKPKLMSAYLAKVAADASPPNEYERAVTPLMRRLQAHPKGKLGAQWLTEAEQAQPGRYGVSEEGLGNLQADLVRVLDALDSPDVGRATAPGQSAAQQRQQAAVRRRERAKPDVSPGTPPGAAPGALTDDVNELIRQGWKG